MNALSDVWCTNDTQ